MIKLPLRATGAAMILAALLNGCGGSDNFLPAPTAPPPPPAVAAPAVQYPQSNYYFTAEFAITKLTPANAGGAVTQWTVSPTLPAGLTFSATSGEISGTPTQPVSLATFTISATNSGGISSFPLTLAVNSGTVVDLGNTDSVQNIVGSTNRFAILFTSGNVNYYDAISGDLLWWIRIASICQGSTKFAFLLPALWSGPAPTLLAPTVA